jgi:hypothetical protein
MTTYTWTTPKNSKMEIEITNCNVFSATLKINGTEYRTSVSTQKRTASIQMNGQRTLVNVPAEICIKIDADNAAQSQPAMSDKEIKIEAARIAYQKSLNTGDPVAVINARNAWNEAQR